MKKNKLKVVLISVFILLSSATAGQTSTSTVDSLQNIIQSARHDTFKIKAKVYLAQFLESNNFLDSAQKILSDSFLDCETLLTKGSRSPQIKDFAQKKKVKILIRKGKVYRKQGNLDKAIEMFYNSKELSEIIDYKFGLAYSYFWIGSVKDNRGQLSDALEYFYLSLALFNEIEDLTGIATSLNLIGAMHDYMGNLDKALKYYTESKELYEELGDEIGIANQKNNIGIVYYLKGYHDKALEYYYESLEIHEKHANIDQNYALILNNIGLIYDNKGDVLRAVSYYERSLRLFENIRAGAVIVLPLNNLGEAYRKQRDYDKALEYYSRSYEITKQMNDVQEEAYTLDKICAVHISANNLEKAEYYCNKCLSLYEEIGDQHGIALAHIGVGRLYYQLNNLDKALENYLKSIKIYESIGDRHGLSVSSSNAGNIFFIKGDYNNAYRYATQAYDLSSRIGSLSEIQNSARLLYSIYKERKDYSNALKYHEEFVAIKDSVVNMDIRNRLQEKYYQYQYETKSIADSIEYAQLLEIKSLELDKQVAESKRQRWLIYSVLSGLVLVLGFSIVISKLFIDKNIANKKLELSYSEINQKNEEIITQRDQIAIQHDFVSEQKALLEKSHRRITDSINYAKLIQTALLPSENVLTRIFDDHLIYYKPSEIVSGDFYWIKEIDDNIYIVVADCTGHGVPGALMSMLGIAFLNEITRRKNVNQTSDILNILRKEVIVSLNQKRISSKANEGIDAGIISINKTTMEAQFSGASASMYLIRDSNKEFVSNLEEDRVIKKHFNKHTLYELKGDKQTIAISKKDKSFNTHKFKIMDGDSFYLFSDGFYDQLNGKTNKRYTSHRFKKLLLNISIQPMSQQYSILDQVFNDWKASNEQTDDVLVLGVKI